MCALNALNAIAFVVALHHTSVANTLIILATTPLIAALMSFAFLGERVAGPTWAAIAAGLAGIAIVAGDGIGRGTAAGDATALLTAAALAGSFVIVRARRDMNMVPAAGCGALLSGVLVLPAADLLSLSGTQIPFTLIMSLGVLPIAFAVLTLGPRTVPAPEVALLLLLETVLGPLWVWLGVGERPSQAAFVGGATVLATLMAHSAWRLGMRGARRA